MDLVERAAPAGRRRGPGGDSSRSASASRIEQLAQLLLAEQLAQQVPVERQRLGPTLRQRRVAVVHVGGDVVEQQDCSRTARPAASRRSWTAISRRSTPPQDLAQRRQVEHVGQALAVRLDEDREAAVAAARPRAGRRRAGAAARAASACPGRRRGQQQRAGRVLAEAAREQRRARRPARRPGPRPRPDSGNSSASISPGGRGHRPRPRAAGSRSRRRTRSSGPRSRAAPGAAPRSPGATARGPGRRTGVRITSRQSPSSSRKRSTTIRRSVGQGARGLALVLEVGEQVARPPARRGRGASRKRLVAAARPLAPRREVRLRPRATNAPMRPAQLDRPADRVALPERQLARDAGRGRDDHPVGRDLARPASVLAPRTMTSPCIPARSS